MAALKLLAVPILLLVCLQLSGAELFYECGVENSEDCQLEYGNAARNGDITDFCIRCASEEAANPLRSRCNICCSKCGGRAYTCGEPEQDEEDCQVSFMNAEVNNELGLMCNRCAREGGDKPLRSRCSLCCTKCVDSDADKVEL